MSETRPSLLVGTLKVASAVAVMSVAATMWLARSGFEQLDPTSLTMASRSGDADPVTTGSITFAAGATRLDPCALPMRR